MIGLLKSLRNLATSGRKLSLQWKPIGKAAAEARG
jgi:hypothetical protein